MIGYSEEGNEVGVRKQFLYGAVLVAVSAT